MSAHVLVRYEITNEEAYRRYGELAGPSVKAHGGSLVIRGKALSHLEGGDHLEHVVVLEFPSTEAAETWFHSPEYTEAKNARLGGGEMTITVLES